MKRCSSVHHHDNDADGDITIAEMYGGCYRYDYMTGIFYDEDMQSVYHATGSSILTL